MGRLFAALASLVFAAQWGSAQTIYDVVIDLRWEAEGRADYPDDPHWSRMLAVTHNSRYALFTDGHTASTGLALLATNGRVSVLEAEIAEAQRRNRADTPIVLKGFAGGSGTFTFELPVNDARPLVSFATMLAPSPDWIAGASGVDLRAGDDLADVVRVPLWVWDAGADSGPDFSQPDILTQPRESIRLLTHPHFLRDDGLMPIGWATFAKRQ